MLLPVEDLVGRCSSYQGLDSNDSEILTINSSYRLRWSSANLRLQSPCRIESPGSGLYFWLHGRVGSPSRCQDCRRISWCRALSTSACFPATWASITTPRAPMTTMMSGFRFLSIKAIWGSMYTVNPILWVMGHICNMWLLILKFLIKEKVTKENKIKSPNQSIEGTSPSRSLVHHFVPCTHQAERGRAFWSNNFRISWKGTVCISIE